MNGSGSLQIGEIATLSDVSVDTIRYYEKLKILPLAARTNSGYRIFAPDTVERIKFIRQAQEMGFSLDEIKQLFSLGDGGDQCSAVHKLLVQKLSELEVKMGQMRNFRKLLTHHLTDCQNELAAHGEDSSCPVLTTIETVK